MAWTADAFLQKRYQAGVEVGEASGEARKEAQIRRFLEEHPNDTAEEVLEFLNQSRRNGHDGKAAYPRRQPGSGRLS